MKFCLYLIRWQLSTPILALAMVAFVDFGTWWATTLSNLIGGCIFFFVDRMIFESRKEKLKDVNVVKLKASKKLKKELQKMQRHGAEFSSFIDERKEAKNILI